MKALFIADLHLCEQEPKTVRAFLDFLRETAAGADALYILGDLFEYWAGDDDRTPLTITVATALKALADQGTQCYFLAGNRDFLLGPEFAALAGLQILADPTLITLDGRSLLLSHGDALCTDDAAYQQFRRQVRTATWQKEFLHKPLPQRREVIEQVRRHSETAKREKVLEIMDVNRDAVADLLRRHDYVSMIHGHTHRPATHSLLIDGHSCERWVLSDWHGAPTYLMWDNGALKRCGAD